MGAPEVQNAVEMRGIVKRFPGVLALDGVDFDLRPGEVHALLGENGAGKSTLMNVLAGLYRPDGGAISVQGQPVSFRSPRAAIAHGLGMVHQHFMLVPSQTVTENIVLGLRRPRFLLRLPELERQVAELQARYGLTVDLRARIWQLSVGEQQRVEILKMLYRGARVLIMDEPTAVLTPPEVGELFSTLRAMLKSGHSVVFISHKLEEVLRIADRVTVLRRGRVTAAGLDARKATHAELARLMVGRDVVLRVEKKAVEPGPVVLSVEGVSAEGDRGLPALRELSLEVRAGEIVGVAGVAGNGQTELAQVITGLRPCQRGRVTVRGEEISNCPPRSAIERKVAHVPEDRAEVGSAPTLGIADNLILKSYRQPPIASGWTLDRAAIRERANRLMKEYGIAAPSADTEARLLSGGNLQKMILAREISSQPEVMIAVQPTRGLDVGAIETVHRLLLKERERGAAILLISEDLDELVALSDRIVVLYEGRSMGELSAREADLERVGLMMAGARGPGAGQGAEAGRREP